MTSRDKIHIVKIEHVSQRALTFDEIAAGVESVEVIEKTEWRWRQVARNGRIRLASTEPFSSKQKCIQNLETGLRGVIDDGNLICFDAGGNLFFIPVVVAR